MRLVCLVVAALAVSSPAFAQSPQACININSAPLEELLRIVHIGHERGAEIIAKRPFTSVDDLTRITGIGPSRLADIKAEGLACVAVNPTEPPKPVATDRIMVQVAAREVLPYALKVTLTTGEVFTVPSSQLVYVRDEWPHWQDEDGDCQDARQEVLIAESTPSAVLDPTGCRVIAGRWVDPLSGAVITDPSLLDVDHVVPLANAFRSGAWGWDRATRTRYANYLTDPWHLSALSASVNRSKGDKGPDEWRPPLQSSWCTYAREWTMIKQRWLLRITEAEQAAINDMLATCTPGPGRAR